ncbi:MAG: phospholipase D-like domain-containing protein [Luteolibacter sp.]
MLDQAAAATELLAASPYITEDRLFARCEPSVAHLYTAFNALNFISGASRLGVLKNLLTAGVKLYHVDSLHAKVVLVDGQHFSLGSQNLTVRGRRINKEASFVSGDESPSEEIRDFFDFIKKSARLITIEDILKMEELIEPWMPKFRKVERGAREIDQEIEKTRLEREEAEQHLKEEESKIRFKKAKEELAKKIQGRMEKERRERMLNALDLFEKVFDQPSNRPVSSLLAKVKTLKNPPKNFFSSTTYTQSLVPVDRDHNFGQLLRSIGVHPKPYFRYLIFNRDTGKLGFVRYAKTQWTFFANGVSPRDLLPVGSHRWKVEIKFDWVRNKDTPSNGTVHLHLAPRWGSEPIHIFSIRFTLSVDGVFLDEPNITEAGILDFVDDYTLDLPEIKMALNNYLPSRITTPFKFEHNKHGKQASDFFDYDSPKTYRIQAHRFGKSAIFSARLYPPAKQKPTLPLALLDLR